jgi:hypothetical protein
MPCDLTLFNLFNFMPLNDNEKNLYNFDKIIISRFNRELDEGFFYLGGQIKMSHNDTINLDSIQQVREIREQRSIEYGPPCNSFEAARIYTTQKEIELIESMIKAYNVIMEIREKEKLNKDNSNYNI